MDEVKHRAPSCFTSNIPHSTEYKVYFTPDFLENLKTLGWHPVDAYQVSPKREENIGFQKHFIKLRNPIHFVGTKTHIQTIPEILLINSYDAKCSMKFYISLYRTISNSTMIMKSEELLDSSGRERMKLPHKGEKNVFGEGAYYKLSQSFDKDIVTVIKLMQGMSKVTLDEKQERNFAKECCRARWDYTYQLLHPKSLLDPWREEDEKNDLLTISYKIQEKLIKGGWTGAGGRAIKPIKDPNREFNINARLFQIIENYYQQQIKK